MRFYLGTHEPCWLKRTAAPLFISRRRLARYARPFGPSLGRWALDSGGFTEIAKFGRWETGAAQYVDEATIWAASTGKLDFAAVQDWMCEPAMLAKTGKTVAEHQALTIASYLQLRGLAPAIPWAPVLQGWAIDDYLGHFEQYGAAGVDLHAAPVVGVGSVCRRQGTGEISELFAELAPLGLRLHAFGLKVKGFRSGLTRLHSCDSMAWSLHAKKRAPIAGHTHKSCSNCMVFALRWQEELIGRLRKPAQERLVFS